MAPNALPKYPDDSIQGVLGGEWWKRTDSSQLTRGRLLRAFVPYVGLTPRTLEVEGRSAPSSHERALFTLAPMRVRQQASAPKIPVAALPNYPGEVYAIYRAKVRPMLLISIGGNDLPKELTKNVGWQKDAALMAAPYFGIDQTSNRAGWQPEFVKRIRRGEYPQYAYDRLPIGGSASESVLRLDHLQPIGRHHDSYELTDYILSENAMEIIDSWLIWLFTERLDSKSTLNYLRSEIPKAFG